MALGATQTIAVTGVIPSYATPASSETITGTDNLFLHVKNANAGELTVTLTDPGKTPAGSSATNPTVTVAATTGDKMIYLPKNLASASTGLITVGFSLTASVTGAVLRL